MAGDVILVPLRGRRIAQAFPLVQQLAPEVTVEAWRDYAHAFARTSAEQPGDAVAACSGDYVRGLYAWRVEPDLWYRRGLVVDCFIVSSLFLAEAVASALLAGLEAAARRHRCGVVRVAPVAAPDWLVATLRACGYSGRGCCLHKAIAAGGPGAHVRGGRSPGARAPSHR